MEIKEMITVENLFREYRVMERGSNWIENLFFRKYKTIEAVKDVSFKINRGEIVGFLGPNGAGKSTVIKMLCGILLPTQGTVTVMGRNPFDSRKYNAYEMGVVFGQRSQLWWDLPIGDTFSLLKKIYKIPDDLYNKNIELYNECLGLQSIWNQPVRQLSLGQRMRAEIAASILHNPKILFLDEPTIGLDVVAKRQIRDFIKRLNEENEITVILTSHDMKDIEVLCDRIIVIDRGRLITDTTLEALQNRYNKGKNIRVQFDNIVENMFEDDNIKMKCHDDGHTWELIFSDDKYSYNSIIDRVMSYGKVCNISILEKTVEDIVIDIYENGLK